jgi:predicted dehydrogenase
MTTIDVDPPIPAWAERPWHIVQESVRATCTHMLEAVRAGRAADTSAEDNLKTFALAEASYEAARTARAVTPQV